MQLPSLNNRYLSIKIVAVLVSLILAQNQIGKNYFENDLIGYWPFDGNGKTTKELVAGDVDSIHYVFNEARFKPSSDPIRRPGIKGDALVFDGFSTKIERAANEFNTPSSNISISVWVAPRSFGSGIGEKLYPIINQQNVNTNEGFALGIYRHGSWSFQFGTGDKWVELWEEGNPIPKEKWSYLTATYDSATGKAAIYLNGQLINEKIIEPQVAILPSSQKLIIGKHNQSETIAGGVFDMNMFNGLMDELKIYDRTLTAQEVKSSFESYLAPHNGQIPQIPYEHIKIDQSKYEGDRHRPRFHAIPPGHWMNEPHAPLYYKGKYHLFYQHNPTGPYWHQIYWGHWVSDDMVHWKQLPVALAPEDDEVTRDGVWSGAATLDEKGEPMLLFTFGNNNKFPNQGVGLARPKNNNDPELKEWVKHPDPIVEQPEGKWLMGEFRDPFVWKDDSEERWYMIVGSGVEGVGGTALFFTSTDLLNWEFKNEFYLPDYDKYPYLGPIWELPVILPIGEYDNGETRYIFLISPVGEGADVEVFYWLGRFDKGNYRFKPDHEQPKLIDVGDFHFTGPSGMKDPRTGRPIVFTIAQGDRNSRDEYDAGWAHNAGLPVQLGLDDKGSLTVEPIEEVASLRGEQLVSFKSKSVPEANQLLEDISGDMVEIKLEIEPGSADKYGIKVRKTSDGEEKTVIFYDGAKGELKADRTKTQRNKNQGIQGGSLDLRGENLKLRIFIDKSLIEVYANKRKSLTTRAYPARLDAKELEIWADGDVKVLSMEVWKMNPIHSDE